MTNSPDATPEDNVAPSAPPPSMKRLGRDALIYGVGMILGRIASFVMLPIYTRLLTPADYGLLSMLDMTVDVAGILMSVWVTAGVLRFYYKAESEEERSAVVGSALVVQVGLNAIGSILLLLGAPYILEHLLDGHGTMTMVIIAATNFTAGSLMVVPLLLMQAEQRPTLYMSLTTGKLVMQLTLNIVLLVGLDMGPLGILISGLTTNLVIGSIALIWMIRRRGLHVKRKAIGDLRRFGFPYQLTTAGTFVLTFGDRFFLEASHGLAAVGLYSLAYQFGFMFSNLGQAPYMRAWQPHRFQLANSPKEVRDASYNQGLLYLNLLLVSLGLGIVLFSPALLHVMAAPEFWGATTLIPIVLLAYMVQAWTDVPQLSIDVSEKTHYLTYATWITVAVIVALYSILIPTYGGVGAAIATLTAFAVRFCLVLYWGQRLWPVDYKYGPHLRLLLLAAVPGVAYFVIDPATLELKLVVATSLYLVYVVSTWLIVLHQEERQFLLDLAFGLPAKIRARLGRR